MDQSLIVAEKYKNQPQLLEQALLGGQNTVTDPYTALNALQKLKQANMMQTAQTAQQAPAAQAAPSIKDSAVAGVNQNRMVAPGIDGDLEHYYGTGGIVAFAVGGDSGDGDDNEAPDDQDDGGGDPNAVTPYMTQIQNAKYTAPTKAQLNSEVAQEMANARQVMGGGDPYADYRSSLQEQEAGAPQELEQGKGIALLKAAAAMAQGNNFVRALGNAGGEFGSAYGDALKADQAAKAHRNEMRFHLADAERKEKLGLYKDAAESVAASHAAALKGTQFELEKTKALGYLAAQQAKLSKGAGAGSAGAQQLEAITQGYIAGGMNPVAAKAKAAEHMLQMAQQKNVFSVSDLGPTKAAQGEEGLGLKGTTQVNTAWSKEKFSPDYIMAPDKAAYEKKWKADYINRNPQVLKKSDDSEPTATPTNRRPLSSFGG